MAQVKSVTVRATLKVVLELDEKEVRALDGIFGYDVNRFLAVFYEKMGKVYVQPHEEGVRSLHATIRAAMHGPLAEIDRARTAIITANRKDQT